MGRVMLSALPTFSEDIPASKSQVLHLSTSTPEIIPGPYKISITHQKTNVQN